MARAQGGRGIPRMMQLAPTSLFMQLRARVQSLISVCMQVGESTWESTATTSRRVNLHAYREFWSCSSERDFFTDKLLVRIHLIIATIRWTGLAPWQFEFSFPGSLTSTCLGQRRLTYRPRHIGSHPSRLKLIWGQRNLFVQKTSAGFLRTSQRASREG